MCVCFTFPCLRIFSSPTTPEAEEDWLLGEAIPGAPRKFSRRENVPLPFFGGLTVSGIIKWDILPYSIDGFAYIFDRGHFKWDPFLGEIKLDARRMVNLRGVPLSSAFFGLVSYHDPCSTTKNFFGEKEVLPAFHCYIVCWSWVPWVGCRLFWWNLRVSFIIFWRHKVVQ